MEDPFSWTSMPKAFGGAAARKIRDRIAHILAASLPQCTLRQFDLPDPPGGRWPILLCFEDYGPVAPALVLCDSRDHTTTDLELNYWLMFWDARDLSGVFYRGLIPDAYCRLDRGSETIAQMMLDAIAKIDLAALVAQGSIERIFAENPRYDIPWEHLKLGKCAAYLGHDEEARSLLRETIKCAEKDGRAGYAGVIAEARRSLALLESDSNSLRQELVEMMRYNWAHFKVVS